METFVLRWTKDNVPFWQGVDDGEKIEINAVADVINENAALKRETLLLSAQLIHAKAHDCMASTAGEWGEAYTWDALSEEMKNHWIQQALLTAEEDDDALLTKETNDD